MHKLTSRFILSTGLIAASMFAAPAVYAQCAAPVSIEGGINYDAAADTLNVCDGTTWLVVGPGAAVPADSIDWDDIIDTMTLDATTTIDMDTNASDLNFDANTFVIDSSLNRIGIGTSSPSANLHVTGTGTIDSLNFNSGTMTSNGVDMNLIGGGSQLTRGHIILPNTMTSPIKINANSGAVQNIEVDLRSNGGYFSVSNGTMGVGTTTPNANAALDVTSTDKGFLPPRNVNPTGNITGTAGLIAYDSTDDELQFYDGASWVTIATSASAVPADSLDWDDFTDTMTLDATTTIDMDTNTADLNVDANTFVIDSSLNRVGIGTSTPGYALDVTGSAEIGRINFPTSPAGTIVSNSVDMALIGGGSQLTRGHIILPNTSTNPIEINAGSGAVQNVEVDLRSNGGYFSVSNGTMGVGTTTPNANAALDVTSTDKGFLPPRNANPTGNITGTAGLIAYDSTDDELQFYDGTSWVAVATATGALAIDDLSDAATDATSMYLGHEAGTITTGVRNVTLGIDAGDVMTDAQDTLAIGYNAGGGLTTGDKNTFLGSGAGLGIGAASQSIFIGNDAGRLAGSGVGVGNNVAIGYNAGRSITAASNVIIGASAGYASTSAGSNVFIGNSAGNSNTTGDSNVAVGHESMTGFLTGKYNTAIGEGTLSGGVGSSGEYNTVLGHQSGSTVTSGNRNILIGVSIEPSAATASSEINIGGVLFGDILTNRIGIGVTNATAINANAALEVTGTNLGFLPPRNTNPTGNITGTAGLIAYDSTDNELQFYDGTAWVAVATASGATAIDDLSDARTNYANGGMYIGQGVNATATGLQNTIIGQEAGNALTTGTYNTFLGRLTGFATTTGSRNTFLGVEAGRNTLGGDNNTFVGEASGYENTSGTGNTGTGNYSLEENLGGGSNSAFGLSALAQNTSGSSNTGLGRFAGANNTTGSFNVSIGDEAMGRLDGSQVTGAMAENVVIGYQAGWTMNGGVSGATNNTIIGFQAGDTTTTGDDNILIGHGIDASSATASNELNIGDILFGSGVGTTAGSKIGAVQYCDENLANCTAAASLGGSNIWTDNTTHVTRENFHILDAGLAAGSTTAGLDGDGTYSFFDPDKGAFRGGTISGANDAWQDANIGSNSFAYGSNAQANGSDSTAIGRFTTASNTNSVALGYATTASGTRSIAVGDGTTASGSSSFASGLSTTASNSESTAMGKSTTASGQSSVAMGASTTASGTSSMAIGEEVKATGASHTMAIGLSDQTAVDANRPQVSGAGSLGIFMDQTDSYNLSTTDTLGIIGGSLMLDDDGTSAATKGCIRFDDTAGALQYSDDCSTYSSFSAGVAADSIDWDDITDTMTVDAATTINMDTNDADLNFDSETLYIDAGNDAVGIGEAPQTDLYVSKQNTDTTMAVVAGGTATAARYPQIRVLNYDNGQGGNPSIVGMQYQGTGSSPSAVTSGNTLFAIEARGTYNTSYGEHVGAAIEMEATQNFGAAAAGAEMSFYTTENGSTSPSKRLTIGNDGNVGIGNADPEVFLHVGPGDVGTSGGTHELFISDSSGQPNILFSDSGNDETAMGITSDDYFAIATEETQSGIQFKVDGTFTDDMLNATTVAMTIQTDGDVGIGDTTPDGTLLLDVEGRIGATEYCDENGANCTAAASLGGGGGGVWSQTGVDIFYNNTTDGDVTIGGATTLAWLEGNGKTDLILEGELYTSDHIKTTGVVQINDGSDFAWGDWSTNITGSSSTDYIAFETAGSEVMRIDSGGDLGIGITNPSVALDVSGSIEYTGTITDVSDARLKENIKPLNKHGSLIDRINKIDTYSFTMKDDEAHKTEYGVIAQQLENIFPDLVHTADDEMGTKSVNYVGLIAPMIEATKELKSENDALKAEIKDIKEDVAGIKIHTGYDINKANIQNLAMMLIMMLFGGACTLLITRAQRKA